MRFRPAPGAFVGKRSHAQFERSGGLAGGLRSSVRSCYPRHGVGARPQRACDLHRFGGENKPGSTRASALDGKEERDMLSTFIALVNSRAAYTVLPLSYLYIVATADTHRVLIRCTNGTPTSGHCIWLCSVNHAKLLKPQMQPPTPRATAAVLLEWTAPMALLQLQAAQIIHRRARRVVPLLLPFHHPMLCPHFRQSAR